VSAKRQGELKAKGHAEGKFERFISLEITNWRWKRKKMSTRKGKSTASILFVENMGKAVFIFMLLLAVTTAAASAQCDHNVTVEDFC